MAGALRLVALLLIAAAGCDRPAAGADSGDSAATAPDTIIRRVVRMAPPRWPSAMQRVTGIVHARRALEPLDSTLAIRVLDQRGAALSRVPVRWTLEHAAEGALLRVLNAVTDANGESRATFTPGRTASVHGPMVDVADVGRIHFAVQVPVASLRVIAPGAEQWSGEEQTVRAALSNSAGIELSGGVLTWASTDSSVLRVRAIDSLSASVTGENAGVATLVASIGAARGSAVLTVRPVLAGRFVTIDGRPVPSMRMEIRTGGTRDTLTVQVGAFITRLAAGSGTDVELRATPLADDFHSVHLRLMSPRDLRDLRIALVPTNWRIEAGSYEGQTVAIDAAAAMRRAGSGAPFWRLAPISGSGPRKLLGWMDADLPLRIAFDRERSTGRISAADSIAFWTIAEQMQRDLGAAVFLPAEIRDGDDAHVMRVEISGRGTDGHTFLAWDQSGDANDGVVSVRAAVTLHDHHVVTHELLHLLGFGHASTWPTVSQAAGGREPRLTPQDVAYVELAMLLRRLQEMTGARPGLPAWTAGDR